MLDVIALLIYDDEESRKEKSREFKTRYASFKTTEEKATYVYSFFYHKEISKAEFAQYFAVELEKKDKGLIIPLIPQYLNDAIEYAASNI